MPRGSCSTRNDVSLRVGLEFAGLDQFASLSAALKIIDGQLGLIIILMQLRVLCGARLGYKLGHDGCRVKWGTVGCRGGLQHQAK